VGHWREYPKVQVDHGCRDKVGAQAMEGMSRRFSRGTGARIEKTCHMDNNKDPSL
jgi:hypothetical protein